MRSIIRRTAGIVALITLPTLMTVAVQQIDAHQSQPVLSVTTVRPGDDNGDGRVDEDESGFDCRTMGNRICGETVAASRPLTAAQRKASAIRACTERAYRDGRTVRRLTPVPVKLLPSCVTLGMRPARKVNANATDPSGPVLVRECRDQGLTLVELGFCMRQP